MVKILNMKTSKKILLFIAILIIAVLVGYVSILRKTVQKLRSVEEAKYQHKTVTVDSFEKLSFSSPMLVKISQGKDCGVEIITGKNSMLKPGVKIIDRTLYCSIDSISESQNTDSIQVRITMPLLHEIKAARGTDIYLSNFQTDSLTINLEDGCAFKGKNNTMKQVSFNTSGNNTVQITSSF